MRCLLLSTLLLPACAPDSELPDPDPGLPPVVVDLEGAHGPEAPPPRFARAVHLRFDVGEVDLSFNDTGVFIATDVPAGGATPYLPLGAVDTVSFQASVEGEIRAEVEAIEVPPGAGAMLAVYGHTEDPRSMALPTNLVGTPGEITVRAIHTTFQLPYAGILDESFSLLAPLTYGAASAPFSIEPDVPHSWYFDLSGDGAPDLPFHPFELSALDSAGRPQVVDIFLIPTGTFIPVSETLSIQVPAMLIIPLDAPDSIELVTPVAPS